jgi:hypothetical protein
MKQRAWSSAHLPVAARAGHDVALLASRHRAVRAGAQCRRPRGRVEVGEGRPRNPTPARARRARAVARRITSSGPIQLGPIVAFSKVGQLHLAAPGAASASAPLGR